MSRHPLALVKHKRALSLEKPHMRRQILRFPVIVIGYGHTRAE